MEIKYSFPAEFMLGPAWKVTDSTIKYKKMGKARVIPFEEMFYAEALRKFGAKSSTPKDASVVGRAVVGAIIAGPTGAVVGALSAVDKNMKNKK